MNWIERKILGFFVKTKGMLSSPILSGKGLIFMLHRVLPKNERESYTLNRDLAITPEKLEEFILFFKEKGYVFLSLDEVADWVDNKIKIKQKFICLTFDDGYRDNLIYGYPILKKHQVPATIYVTNCLPNGTGVLWWYLFENHAQIMNRLILNSSVGEVVFEWKDVQDAHKQFGKVSEAIKSIPVEELVKVLSEAFDVSENEFKSICKEVSLTWVEIKELSNEPLISIGSHTMNHISARNQKEDCVKIEMLNSKLEIEQKIGKQVNHFAYPFGGEFDVSSRDINIATQIGFRTSALNQPGNIFKSNKFSKQALMRMPLGNRTDDERMKNYLNGIYHFSVNGFKKNLY